MRPKVGPAVLSEPSPKLLSVLTKRSVVVSVIIPRANNRTPFGFDADG